MLSSGFSVVPVTREQCRPFIMEKHYAKRMPIFWHGFGLERDGRLEGVCVYGQPSPNLQKSAFRDREWAFLELVRLVIQTDEPNAASTLVGQSLQMLPRPCAVVSFADTAQGHSGIVYQATNWTYTGATVSHDKAYIVNGKAVHPMTLRDRGITSPAAWAKENGIETVKPQPKHRYFFFVGSARQKGRMKRALTYPIVQCYPKSEKRMYDAGPRVEVVLC